MQNNIINWSGISQELAGNDGSIRSNKIPEKYKQEVGQLQHYINCWKNTEELLTKEQFMERYRGELEKDVKELAETLQKMQDIANKSLSNA